MSNQLMTFEYEDNKVEFYTKENGVVMVNATQMAKIYDKRMNNFFEADETKNFIKSCMKPKNKEKLKINTEEDLFSSVKKSGTWMHRVLALKFAAWLNSDFELWVYYTINQIIEGEFGEMKEYKDEVKHLEKQMNEIKSAFNLNYKKIGNNPYFIKHFELEKQLNAITKKMKSIGNKASRKFLDIHLFSQFKS